MTFTEHNGSASLLTTPWSATPANTPATVATKAASTDAAMAAVTVKAQKFLLEGAATGHIASASPTTLLDITLEADGIVSGTVRDMNEGLDVAAMELEHYPGMTEKSIEAIVEQARGRWPLSGALVIHRVGPLLPQEQIVLVAVSSAHRGEAFAACEFIIDYLKTEAPFWKKEDTPEGARWVDARDSDETALDKWTAKAPAM